MKKAILILIAAFAVIVIWHFHAATQLASGITEKLGAESDAAPAVVEINPVTNVAVFTLPSGGGAPAGHSPEYFEQALADLAGRHLDIYAKFIPYRVRIVETNDPTFIATGEMSKDGKLYAAPGGTGAPVATLSSGEPLMVLSATSAADGKWVQVRTRANQIGWVRGEHVTRR